jgi:hypothetical protein
MIYEKSHAQVYVGAAGLDLPDDTATELELESRLEELLESVLPVPSDSIRVDIRRGTADHVVEFRPDVRLDRLDHSYDARVVEVVRAQLLQTPPGETGRLARVTVHARGEPERSCVVWCGLDEGQDDTDAEVMAEEDGVELLYGRGAYYSPGDGSGGEILRTGDAPQDVRDVLASGVTIEVEIL